MLSDAEKVYKRLKEAGILRKDKKPGIMYERVTAEEERRILKKRVKGLIGADENSIIIEREDLKNAPRLLGFPAKPTYTSFLFGEEGCLVMYTEDIDRLWDWDGSEEDKKHLDTIRKIMKEVGYVGPIPVRERFHPSTSENL